MTPAERDEVRRIAADNAKRRGHADACDCDRCRHDRAVLRYVPAGEVTPPIGFIVQPVAATDDKPASVVTVTPKGRFYPLDATMARQMGAAYYAAADAAEETTR